MTVIKTSRGHSTTRRRRKLRKEIKESLMIAFFGSIVTILAVALWIGSVIQESEKLCPVTEEEISEVAE